MAEVLTGPTDESAEPNDLEERESESLPYPVVGIGASAGGVEAYIDLLGSLPSNTGMTFILVPHLAPDYKSHMVEILAKHTAMPILTIENGARPEPNHVYVVPPNYYVSLSQGILQLKQRGKVQKVSLAIDYFFRSLATDQKNKAVGVVLSGMDGDGAAGLNAIKGEGGITIVQDPASAQHPGMPLSSIKGDHVDKVVPPAQIAEELSRLGKLFSNSELVPLENGGIGPSDEEYLRKIFRMLQTISGLNFALYKPGTVHRRVARRLLVNQIVSLRDYVAFLQSSPEELRNLQEDLLVGLTRFFRDPEMFDSLKVNVLPKIFSARPLDQPVRFWIAGCSTGEEVYSLVITLLEYTAANHLEHTIQIFGTDPSERSIEKARNGIYPESLMAELSAERLRRFFVHVENGYQVSKRVRDLCIFARQNLCFDPPFSRLDLISCRNVLIYLGQQLQRQVIPTFHYALKPAGYLVLGMSETIRDFSDLFDTTDRKYKIFAKIPSATTGINVSRHFVPNTALTPKPAESSDTPVAWSELELQRAADRIVVSQYGPPGFVVNDSMEILQSRGNVSPYIDMAQGAASFHLLRMLHSSFATSVRDGIQRAIDQDIPVKVQGLSRILRDAVYRFNLEVLPIQAGSMKTSRFLVLFIEVPGDANSAGALPAVESVLQSQTEPDLLASQLRQDLTSTKVYLQSLIEERDIRNQELTSSNEEVQAANEELQSTNEELETTKEELQSANEELQTINEELSQRNTILAEASNDLSNLLTSVNIPVLMLNNDLEIRQLTPLTEKLLNVRGSDVGRPLSEIRLNISGGDLESTLRDVLDTLSTREVEVQDKEGRWHLLRVRPYRTRDNKIEGVVLVMLEVDQLRRSQIELRGARDFARDIIESVQVPVVILDRDLSLRSANEAFRFLINLSPSELEGRLFSDLTTRVWGWNSIHEILENIGPPESESSRFEGEFEVMKAKRQVLYLRARSLQVDGSSILLLTLEDITNRKEAEQVLARENQLLAGQVRSTSQALGRTQEELRALTARLFTSQEEERQRVARELHDDVGQQLALVQMDIEQVQTRLTSKPDSLTPQLDALSARIASLSNDVRNLSHRLHPAMLDDLGLGFALRSLVEEFGEREQMPVTFTRINVPESLSKPIAAALYRITQEALRNVSKHAGKTHVRVLLEGGDHNICLEVVDMGEGFDQEQRVFGLGLLSMAERAHLVGGTFEIQSELGRGTSIAVKVPLNFKATS